MAGFCIEVQQTAGVPPVSLRLVDLAQCSAAESFQQGDITAAWIRPETSHHYYVRRSAERLLLIEGAPDRLPREGEAVLDWLPGRWGSFRGFELSSTTSEVTAFVDPVCSRPVFFRASAGQLLIADKLSTLALNTAGEPSLDWNGVFEAMLLGSIYRYQLTSLAGAEEIAPGETIVFRQGQVAARHSNSLPDDEAASAAAVREDPEGTLRRALERSVRECWTDQNAALMLSGGLDSRAILALAGEGRRAVTLQMTSHETVLAKQIAEVCHADFIVRPFPADEWLNRARQGFWIAAATRDTEFVNDIGLAGRLAPYNIHAIAHGYLFDTLLKGWLIRPWLRGADLSNSVLGKLGPAGAHLRDITSRASFDADRDVLGLLSREGAQQAIAHLRTTAESLQPTMEGRLNLTFERHVLGWMSKQVHYGCFLSWIEGLDLSSPIFHPALWSWCRHSTAEDRYLGRAFRRALIGMHHPVFAIPDANTNAPIGIPQERWTDRAQDQLWYRAARRLWRVVRKDRPVPFTDKRAARFRTPEGRQLMEFGLETLRKNPMFSAPALEQSLAEFSAGNDRPFEPLLTITGVAQWSDLVARRREYTAPQIREISIARSVENH